MLSKALCLTVLGAASVAAMPVVYAADKTPTAQDQEAQNVVRSALKHLEAARLDLTAADPLYSGRRGQAIEQTDYAIEQTMVGLADYATKEQGRLNWERIRKEAEEKAKSAPAGKDAAAAKKASDERMKSALNHLIEGHKILKSVRVTEFGGHKAKAVYFAEEAMRDVRESLGLPREGK